VQRFRCGLVFKADRLLYHSTLGVRVIKKKKKKKKTETETDEGSMAFLQIQSVGLNLQCPTMLGARTT